MRSPTLPDAPSNNGVPGLPRAGPPTPGGGRGVALPGMARGVALPGMGAGTYTERG